MYQSIDCCMKKIIGSLILFFFGWKTTYPVEYQINKMIMLAVPHTSNWDTLFTLAAYWKEGLEPKFLIHDRYTKGFFGFFFKKLGAIGVDKKQSKNLVNYSVDLFEKSSKLLLVIAPEGTKHKVTKWRTGFFNIAQQAKVPLSLGRLDYQEKKAGIGGLLNMTGNFEEDMTYIQNFYEKSNPKHPYRYNKRIF